jgi:hypothetical protein
MMKQPPSKLQTRLSTASNTFTPNKFDPVLIVPIAIVLLSLAFLAPFPSKAATKPQTLAPQALGSLTPGSQTSGSQGQVLALMPDRRIEASICPDSMNRIAIANDRIIRIFGDDGTFESQNDEDTGQIFLKPTAENGAKSLSITLVTEQGITQDLTLKPTAPSARTLIFKSPSLIAGTNRKTGQGIHHTGSSLSSSPFGPNSFETGLHPSFSPEHIPAPYHHLLALLKRATAGKLPLQESGSLDPYTSLPSIEGLEVSYHQSYVADPYPYDVHAFHMENTQQTVIELQEKSFYQPGDLAISLQKRILPPGTKTLLYVVRLPETRRSETLVSETQESEAQVPGTHVSKGGSHD